MLASTAPARRFLVVYVVAYWTMEVSVLVTSQSDVMLRAYGCLAIRHEKDIGKVIYRTIYAAM